MQHFARAALALPLACLMAACASTGTEYPSLAVRDVERAEGRFETGAPARLTVPPVEVDLTGGLDARLASLLAAAQDAHAEFTRVEPRATRLATAARGSGVGSDAWSAAQIALAELDSARSRAAVPLGDLDMLYAAANVAAEDTTAIEATRNKVIALVGEEDRTLEALRAQVR